MSSRFARISGVLTILAGIAIVELFQSERNTDSGGENASDRGHRSDRQLPTKPSSRDMVAHNRLRRAKLAPTLAELIEQYGQERVEQAQRIFPTYIRYNKGHLHTVDSLFGSKPHAILVSQAVISNSFGVTLETGQEERTVAICYEYALRELAEFRNAILELETHPEPLLELMLAADARAQGEITDEDYAALQQKHSRSFGYLMNPLTDRTNQRFWVKNLTKDSILRQEMQRVFIPEQLRIFKQRIEEYDTSEIQPEVHGLATMRVMDLERLEMILSFQSGAVIR